MDAIISGRAGVAFLVEGEVFKSFDVEDPTTLLPRRAADLRLLFGEASDLEFFEDVDYPAAARHLERAFNCASALDLALILFDPELTDNVRDDAVEELERLLSEKPVADYLENVLYARPLPAASDLAGALARCAEGRLPKLSEVLQLLEGYQPSIRAVRAAWDVLPTQLFGGEQQKSDFQHAAVREGLFRQLVIEVASGPRAHVGNFFVRAGTNHAITSLRNYREVIQHWTSPFHTHTTAPRIRHEADDFSEKALLPRKERHKPRRRWSAEKPLEKLQGQFNLIVSALEQRDLALARKITNQVINYQLETTKPIRAAKTLCNLATEAKALGMYSLQFELTEWAIQIAPDDGWSWTQYADALLQLHRLADALKAYEQAESFGAGVVAKSGRAETLRAMGRLDDALSSYDAVLHEDANDIIARNGRAETLRAMGRLQEALAAYDSTLSGHPERVDTKAGRAETLRAMGRLDKALAAYDSIVADHPDDVVSNCGRAEVLKALRRWDEALKAYDKVFAANPNNAFIKNGRSGVLLAMRRYDEALELLPVENPIVPSDWIGFHIRGMVLLRRGNIDEAVRIFEHGVRENPIPSSREYFRNALAAACLRRGDFAGAGDALEGVKAPLLQPQANILRLHKHGAKGEKESAIAAYDKLREKPWFISDELVAELHRKYILKEMPQHDEDWVFEQEMDMFFFDPNQQILSYSSLVA
jgi:tetratricopeptide (TPR) repeat protein